MSITKSVTEAVPEKSEPARRLRLWQWAVVIAAAAAFCCKILLALKTYGTNDVYSFEQTLEWWHYLGTDLYRLAPGANNPPSMLYVLAVLRWLAQTTGLSFSFWVRVPSTLADLGNLWLVWRILKPRLGKRSIRWALVLMAAAPALILISGFHGQNDSVMICFLLLSTYFVEKGRTVAGGAAFGLSMCVKVVPVIAVPALIFYQFGRRKWIVFFAVAGAVVAAAWSPFLIHDARAVFTDVFGYKSGLGHWGVTYLTYQLSLICPVGATLCRMLEKLGSPVLLLTIAVVSWWMNHTASRPSLYSQIGLVFFLFLAGTTGFGVQYLAWLVPWAVGLGFAPAALYYATSGMFLFLVYDYWSQGLPWYIADSIRWGDYYYAGIDYFHILCWLSVAGLAWISWRQIRGRAGWAPAFGRLAAPWRRLTLVFASLLILLPAAQWMESRQPGWAGRMPGSAVLSAARKRYLLELSAQLHTMGRLADSAEVAKRAATGQGLMR